MSFFVFLDAALSTCPVSYCPNIICVPHTGWVLVMSAIKFGYPVKGTLKSVSAWLLSYEFSSGKAASRCLAAILSLPTL